MPNHNTHSYNKNKNKGKYGSKNKGNKNNNFNHQPNIYEVCGIVQKFIGNTCHKYNINPSVLYEELHYQLPAEWVEGLRFIIRNSARIQVKREYDISSSESSVSSAI